MWVYIEETVKIILLFYIINIHFNGIDDIKNFTKYASSLYAGLQLLQTRNSLF